MKQHRRAAQFRQTGYTGGIHDADSAAGAAAVAATLAASGVGVGVLAGTGDPFAREAVDSGAITAEFQRTAVDCADTVLLESGPGHATRCARTPLSIEFQRARQRLIRDKHPAEVVRASLEELNLGVCGSRRRRCAATGQNWCRSTSTLSAVTGW